MTGPVLVDTGPLVAMLSHSDQYHDICVEQLRSISPPLLCCWPVLTEAAWLLRNYPEAMSRLLRDCQTGVVQLLDLDSEALEWIREFMTRYRSIGAQLADASLVYLAEREGIETVFTLDRRDFSVFRTRRRKALRLIPEV